MWHLLQVERRRLSLMPLLLLLRRRLRLLRLRRLRCAPQVGIVALLPCRWPHGALWRGVRHGRGATVSAGGIDREIQQAGKKIYR